MRLIFRVFGLPLILAAMACSFTTQENAEDESNISLTDVAGVEVIGGTTPTQPSVFSTATPQTTVTTAPTLIPTQNCSVRTDWFQITVQSGDTLSRIAQRSGSSIDELVAANCLSDPSSLQAGQSLRVPVVIPPTVASNTSSTGNTNNTNDTNGNAAGNTSNSGASSICANTWFFDFNSDVSELRCPSALVTTNAAGQDFEGGRAFWYAAGGIYDAPVIYVAFNDGGWAVYGDTWTSDQPFDDPTITPPDGRFQPVAGIGLIWRTQPGLRDKLGWAFEPEQAYTGRRQQPTYINQNPDEVIYLDYGKRGLVMRLTSESGGNQTQAWIVAGGYDN